MKQKNLIAYAGLAIAAVLLLPKLLRKNQGDSSVDTAGDAPTDTNNIPIVSSQPVNVSNIKLLTEKVTANGANFNIYVYLKNPSANDAVLKSLQGDIYLGPSKILPLSLVRPISIPALDEAIIPITSILSFKAIPSAVANQIAMGTWIPGAIFKGKLELTNGSGLKIQQPLEKLDPNTITGFRRVKFGLPYI